MAESWASTDLGEVGLQALETALFATPIFFNVQPRHLPFHLTKGKRDKGRIPARFGMRYEREINEKDYWNSMCRGLCRERPAGSGPG